MSPEKQPQGEPRLLPESLEDRLLGMLGRIAGIALIAATAAGWLALLSWSVGDPSLTHATSGTTRNLLGSLGAIFSDLMLQTLGFAAAVALLSPMFWGAELALHERIVDFRAKLVLYPIAVLLLAGALSSLPTSAGWPLHHGFGGILGDVLIGLAGSVLGLIGSDRAGALAGLGFFAAGFAAQASSLGHDLASLGQLIKGRAQQMPATGLPSWQMPVAARRPALLGVLRGMSGWRRRQGDKDAAAGAEPGFAPAADSYWGGDREAGMRLRFPEAPAAPVSPAAGPSSAEPWRAAPTAMPAFSEPPDDDSAADGPLDPGTEAESRAIAERFAPPVGQTSRAAARIAGPSRILESLTRRVAHSYRKPSLNLLKRPVTTRSAGEHTQAALRGTARLLEDVLADFGIKGEIKDIHPGPVVTLFELEPARGTKAARIVGLADDIARQMSAPAARVTPVPGRNVIGIELPNARREGVLLREVLESEAYRTAEATLPLALGRAIGGEAVVCDLARMPHVLIAGTTGSGKSVGINAFILSLLYRMTPEECRLLLIDPKMLELSVYNGIPHLLAPVVTEPARAVAALEWAVGEMEERYKRMARLSVRNIDVYNNRVRNAMKRGETLARTVQTGFDPATGEALYEQQTMPLETLPYIVIVIDELADLMITAGKEVEAALQRLAQMARAAGIHLVMATQRPSVDIVTGTIKANFPTRISFKVASRIDSRTILNEQGAEQLLGQGDMLLSFGTGQLIRVHGAFVSDEEVESIATSLREQGAPRYVEGITERADPDDMAAASAAETADEVYDKAVAIVLRDRKASVSYLQRRLSIGYNRAADLIERMEADGIVGPANGVGRREILVDERGAADAA